MDCPIQEPEVLYSVLYFPTPAFSNGKLCICIAASPPVPAERWLPPSITGKQAREVLVWLLCKLEGAYLRVSGRTSLFTVKQCKNDYPCFVSPCLQGISVWCKWWNLHQKELRTLTGPLIGQQLVAFLAAALKTAHRVSTHMITSTIVEAALVNICGQRFIGRSGCVRAWTYIAKFYSRQ